MSQYCTASDCRNIFGRNIDTWAAVDKGATKEEINSRIQHAIEVASEEIDSHLRNSWYKLPLTDSSGNTPVLIKEIAATLAGIWLYELHGERDLTDDGKPVHRYIFKRQWAYETLLHIRNGTILIDALRL